MDKMLILQISQFILTFIEVGMCYLYYDMLIGKNKVYRHSRLLECFAVFLIGSLLCCNRMTTCFMSNVFYVAQSLLMAISGCIIYKDKYSTSLCITLSYFVGVGLIHIVLLFLTLLLVKEERFFRELYDETGVLRIVVMIISLLIIGGIYCLFLRWKKGMTIRIQNIKKVLLVFGFFGWWTISWGQTQILELGSRWAFWSLGTVVFTLGTIIGSCYLFYGSLKKDIEISTIQMKNQMLDNLYDDIKLISEHCLCTTHDMKNHILVLKNYAEKKDIEKMQDYLDKIGDPISKMNQYIWCKNDTVNLIINTKVKEAQKNNILVETNIDDADFPLNDNELCSVFANILDNAVEACKTIYDGERWIKINIVNEMNCLIIKIVNSISEIPKKNKEVIVSSKAGHMGYGLKSVAAIVDKYEGTMKCDFDRSSFTTIITFWRGR